MDCSPWGSSVHRILWVRILEWVAISYSREFSQPRDWTWVSCMAGRFFTIWATSEAWTLPKSSWKARIQPAGDFPGSLVVKTLSSHRRGCRFNPWVGKITWRRAWHPTPAFLPGEFHGQRSLAGYSSWGHKELDTTEWPTVGNIP